MENNWLNAIPLHSHHYGGPCLLRYWPILPFSEQGTGAFGTVQRGQLEVHEDGAVARLLLQLPDDDRASRIQRNMTPPTARAVPKVLVTPEQYAVHTPVANGAMCYSTAH